MDDPAHAFVIEGGLIVANCVRYFIASRAAAAIEPPKAKASGTLAEVLAAHRQERRSQGQGPRPGERLRSRWR